MAEELVATSSTVVYRNRWMTVREDTTRRRTGRGHLRRGRQARLRPRRPVLRRRLPPGRAVPVRRSRAGTGSSRRDPGSTPPTPTRSSWPAASWPRRPACGPGDDAAGIPLRGVRVLRPRASTSSSRPDLTPGERSLDEEEAGLVSRWFPRGGRLAADRGRRLRDAPSVAALALLQQHRLGGRRD